MRTLEEPRLLIPLLVTVLAVALGLLVARKLLDRWEADAREKRFRSQMVMLGLSLAGLLAILFALPLEEAVHAQVINVAGIVLSAAVALSSTTLLGNLLAGLMLRGVRSFRPGEFLRVGEHFGRVTERGAIFTEIQTEDSDLVSIPNLYLAQNPVKVVRAQGTVVSATVSLGYDVPRASIQEALLRAAEQAELSSPFVLVLELGDFSVTYRAGGLLTDVKNVISTRSNLRAAMLDALHEAGIEIVSPTFMNTRALDPARAVVPTPGGAPAGLSSALEAIAFDKADEAEVLEALRAQLADLHKQRERLAQEAKQPGGSEDLARIESERERLEARAAHLAQIIATRAERLDEE